MNNDRWGYIFLTSLSVTNMILLRTYFQTAIPCELLESAKMDGITDFKYLFKIKSLPIGRLFYMIISSNLAFISFAKASGFVSICLPTFPALTKKVSNSLAVE